VKEGVLTKLARPVASALTALTAPLIWALLHGLLVCLQPCVVAAIFFVHDATSANESTQHVPRRQRRTSKATSLIEWTRAVAGRLAHRMERSLHFWDTREHRQQRHRREHRTKSTTGWIKCKLFGNDESDKPKGQRHRRSSVSHCEPEQPPEGQCPGQPAIPCDIAARIQTMTTTMKATGESHKGPPVAGFDADSCEIGVDNRCSKCTSNHKKDFVGDLKRITKRISGCTGATVKTLWEGTIKWSFEDDQGRASTFLIPESMHDPEGGHRLLSPQHWAQTQKQLDPMHHGTHESAFDDEVVLCWKSKTRQQTIPLDNANVGAIWSAPGCGACGA